MNGRSPTLPPTENDPEVLPGQEGGESPPSPEGPLSADIHPDIIEQALAAVEARSAGREPDEAPGEEPGEAPNALRSALERQEREAERLRSALERQERELERLRSALERRERELERLRSALVERLGKLDELRRGLERERRAHRRTEEARRVLWEQNRNLEKLLKQARQGLAELQRELELQGRRARREREEAHRGGREQLLHLFLAALDDLDRALEHAENAPPEQIRQGLELLRRNFRQSLLSAGVRELRVEVGDPFDPTRQEAVSRVEGTGQPGGTVVAVLRRGFSLDGRLLRPAQVAVAAVDEAPVPPGQDDAGPPEPPEAADEE